MAYDEIKNLKVSDVLINTDLKKLTKQCLSIVDTSTLKDDEITLYINAAILDLKRLGIDSENKIQDQLIQAAIVMYVKASFGMCDVKEKELAEKRYKDMINNISLYSEYKVGDNDA